MIPLTLMLFNPAGPDVRTGLRFGRVAAVFKDVGPRQAICSELAGAVRSSTFIGIDSASVAPIAESLWAEGVTKGSGPEDLLRAALAYVGVPYAVALMGDDAFDALIVSLRTLPRQPRAVRFVGWTEGRREQLLELGFKHFTVHADMNHPLEDDIASWFMPPVGDDGAGLQPGRECIVNARR